MSTVIIVGAGFSLDANRYLDPSDAAFAHGYPLVGELAAECFDGTYDLANGVEPAFAEALRRGDREPVRKLVERIENADHYVGARAARESESAYTKLIDRFPGATFLSFNYDALLEILLHARGFWIPRDGFGVPCHARVDPAFIHAPPIPDHSMMRVFHLHGSAYLYPLEFETYGDESANSSPAGTNVKWIRETATEEFRFDPDALGDSFIPYRSGAEGMTYKFPDERIIVPAPDKAPALAKRFSRAVYMGAIETLRCADECIAIGYRFADCDAPSFLPLLAALDQSTNSVLHLVAPDASDIRRRLERFSKTIGVIAHELSFAEWAAQGFPK